MHSYGRGLEGVGWGEGEGAPVLAIVVRGVGGSREDVVPSATSVSSGRV